MIEINEEKFPVRLFGKDVELEYPTAVQVEQVNEKLQAPENKGKELTVMREFFSSIGIEEADLNRLTLNHITKLFSAIMPKKN